MSIQPKWLAKILDGEKTIDIRKTMPKCELPIDVYLYCTKGKKYLHHDHMFLTDNDRLFLSSKIELPRGFILNGKVVVKFTLNKVEEVVDNGSSYRINNDVAHTNEVARNSCLDFKEMKEYLGGKNGYAWHIDNLVIFDKPKELSDFYGIIHYPKGQFLTPDICNYGEGYEEDEEQCLKSFKVNKAPQSWQYAYVKDKV